MTFGLWASGSMRRITQRFVCVSVPHRQWWLTGAIACSLTGSVCAGSSDVPATEYSTPSGITLIEAAYRAPKRPLDVQWINLGDEQGRTLFISDQDPPGQSRCVDKCAEIFPPVLAPPDAKPAGAWSLIARADDTRQWAYKGKPLYRFARESRLHEVVDNLLTLKAQQGTNLLDNYKKPALADDALLPPPGWHVARYNPVADLLMPGVINIGDVPAALGHAFVTTGGKTLYEFLGDSADPGPGCPGCSSPWRPLEASEMANSVGEFTPVRHSNGYRQWAYRGNLLFTSADDHVKGDIKGIKEERDPLWRIAVLERHFMPAEAGVRWNHMFGYILSSADGLPLYSRYSAERYITDTRTEDDVLYIKGKLLGVKGCDAKCLETWRPLLAPPGARSQGFWEVIDRGDGTRQWAYKGFVQFTNINDKPYGVVTANNQYVYVVGDKSRYSIADTLPSIHKLSLTPGFHWRVTDLQPRPGRGM